MDPFLPSRSEHSLYFLTVDNTIEICIAHEWLWETVKKKKKNKQKLVNILTAWVKGLPCIASTNKLYPNLCLHFSLISIFLSFSDQAFKIHFLNIKRGEQPQLFVKM